MDLLLRNALLYDFYGDLLTDRQKNIYHMYFCDNLSLAEIGCTFAISRQAVNFSLKQSQKSLEAFEQTLKLVERHAPAQEILATLRSAVEREDYTECIRTLDELEKLL